MRAIQNFAALILLLPLVCFCAAAGAAEGGWPEGYAIAEKSESPDHHYGVMLPSLDVANTFADEKIPNALVNLKTHRRLAVVRGAHYFPGENHRGLMVAWAADSSWCAVTYEARYGFDSITIVEIQGAQCSQIDLGPHIQKALDGIIAQQAHDKSAGGYGSAHFRSAPGRKILVRATGYTNPKAFENQPTYCSLFQGTFDLAARKWSRSEARKISSGENDQLETAYSGDLEEGITFDSEENRLSWYDDRLNEVYTAVRLVLPADRFAAVKREQFAWLKQFEAVSSKAKKCDFIAARIEKLRGLVW